VFAGFVLSPVPKTKDRGHPQRGLEISWGPGPPAHLPLVARRHSRCYDCGHMAEDNPALKIAVGASDLLNKLLGPGAAQLGQVLGYKLYPYTVKNFVTTMKKTKRLLRAAGLPANPVPPRFLLPFVENSSIEDNDSLQEMWAGLLATASQQGDSVSPSFIETLKQLTPDEARYFEKLRTKDGIHISQGGNITPYAFGAPWGAPAGCADTFERLGLIRRVYGIADNEPGSNHPEIGHMFAFTDYGGRFLAACRGPLPKSADAPAPARPARTPRKRP
jgi:hypothetical protein